MLEVFKVLFNVFVIGEVDELTGVRNCLNTKDLRLQKSKPLEKL